MACVVPCVRFNDVVRSLMSEVCVPACPDIRFTGSLKSLASLLQRRGFLYSTVTPLTDLSSSFITATLGTNGWLGLVRQGLSPCKKRQASLGAHCGRTASYPTGPAQIPACGTIAPGFSPVPAVLAQAEVLASAKALSLTRDKHPSYSPGAIYDMRFHNAKLGQELFEPLPIIALSLAALI